MQFYDVVAVIGAAGITTLTALFWIARHQSPWESQPLPPEDGHQQRITFLFEGPHLNHASDAATKRYQLTPGLDDWRSLRKTLLSRFPEMPEQPQGAGPGKTIIPARHLEDTATLSLTRDGTFLRVNMLEEERQTPAQTAQLKTLQLELQDLRRASDTTPHAIWQVNAEGIVTWHNPAYEALYGKLHGTTPEPETPVFKLKKETQDKTGHQRVATQATPEGAKDWYDVSTISVGDIDIFHAVDVNAVVKSEIAQRNFVQTLAKTFAQLSIGLAIFDRNGQLALFNPALIDLTNLPADFLSGRPTLLSFFDRIRENRRMPEPKNYHSWRQQIAKVIAAATDGRYQETWTLETGQTYRVNGRPHPDGAIAFLIEDISAEVSLTRNFRAELELGQSLMDTFDDALAVFSSAGVLTFSNLAYRELWGQDPENSFADVTITDCVKGWKSLCKPGAQWAAMTNFVLDFGERTTWEMPVTVIAGKHLTCIVSRIASGATIVRFTHVQRPEKTAGKRAVTTRSS